MGGLLIIIASAALHMRTEPFTRPILNQIELTALFTQCGSLFAGLYLLSPNLTSTTARLLCTAVVVGSNVLFLGFALWHAIREARRESPPKLGGLELTPKHAFKACETDIEQDTIWTENPAPRSKAALT